MLEKLAQKIAVYTSEVIGYDVIITDEESIVIGASDVTRVGDFHEGSVRVVGTGKPSSQFSKDVAHMKGTKPGFTIPIFFSGKVIGTIGITGERENVEKFGLLVQRQAEMMLREELFHKTTLLREQAIQNLIQEIIAFDPAKHDESLLLARGYELGFDLKPPHITIVVDLFQFTELTREIYRNTSANKSAELSVQSLKLDILSIIKYVFNAPNDISTAMGTDKFIILYALHSKFQEEEVLDLIKEKCSEIISQLQKKEVSVTIGIGAIAKNISELSLSCREAWHVLEIGKKIHKKPNILQMKDFYLENMITNINKDVCEWYIKKTIASLLEQSDWPELSRTIRAWCEAGFNKIEASKNLHIHRNTLQYRLEKINQIAGTDIENYKNATILYLALLMTDLMGSEI